MNTMRESDKREKQLSGDQVVKLIKIIVDDTLTVLS